MATKRQKIEVGVFLATAFVLLAVVLAALAGLRRQDLVAYYMEFDENVAGLSEGSRVTYRGVPVGKITDLVITSDNRIRVRAGIDPRKIRPRKDIMAKLTMESVFGPIAVDLFYPGDMHQPFLKRGATIPVEGSLRQSIEHDVPMTLEKLATVMARIDNTLAAIKPEDVSQTLDSLRSAVTQFDNTLAKIKPEDVEQLVQQFDKLLKATDGTLAELRKQTDSIASTLQGAIKQGSTDVANTSAKIGQSLDKLQKATDETTKLVRSINAIVEKNRQTVASSLAHVDGVLAKADKQLGAMDLPATEKALREAAAHVGAAAKSIGHSRDDFRRSLDGLERSVTHTLDELDRTLRSTRRLIDYLERDPASIIRGREQEKK